MSTKKTTKTQIQETVTTSTTKIKDANANKLDPAKIAADKRAAEVLTTANKISSMPIEDQVAAIQKNVGNLFAQLITTVTDDIKGFSSLKDAKATLEKELEDLYGIKVQAETLAALINGHETKMAELTEEHAAAVAKNKADLAELTRAYADKEAELRKHYVNISTEAQQAHIRAEQEWNYNFGRKKVQDTDALKDELASKRKAHDEQVAAEMKDLAEMKADLDKREAAISAQENEIIDLKEAVAGIPAKVEAAAIKAATDAATAEKAKFHAEKGGIEKEFKGQIAVLEAQKTSLADQLAAAQARIVELSADLKAANERGSKLAETAINGARPQIITSSMNQAPVTAGK